MKKALFLLALVLSTPLFAQKCDLNCLTFDIDKRAYKMSYDEYLEYGIDIILSIKNNCTEACTYRFSDYPLSSNEDGLSPLVFEVYQVIGETKNWMYTTENIMDGSLEVIDPITGEINRMKIYRNELLQAKQIDKKEIHFTSFIMFTESGSPIYNKDEEVKYFIQGFYRNIYKCADNITCEDHIPLPVFTVILN